MNKSKKSVFAKGYIRVSTNIQVETGHSLSAQADDIKRYCQFKQLNLVKNYIDEGLSGKSMDRPELQLLIEELNEGEIIIIKSISRISRNLKDTLHILDIIKSKKCNIVILDLDIDTRSASGDLMINIMGSIAQFERINSSLKVSNTLDHMSREGKLITKPPFGYKISKTNGGSCLIEDDYEQSIINIIRNYIREDPKITIGNIVRLLNQQPDIKIRKSKKIYPVFVKNVILNNKLR